MTSSPEGCGPVIPQVSLLSFEEPRKKGTKERRKQNLEIKLKSSNKKLKKAIKEFEYHPVEKDKSFLSFNIPLGA